MEEYHQITLDEWTSWKEDIRNKLAETAQNFVYIGYRLKQIRDSGMFGGAADVFEFAQNEYGLGKSTVSRFIAINEKYSKEGNSLELKDEYKGFSSSKLSEMLSLPDSECELITEQTTVKDIREFKNFTKQDPVEPEPAAGNPEDNALENVIIDYFKDKKDMLNEAMKLIRERKFKEFSECINPSGNATHSKGICFLFLYGFEQGIKYKILMNPVPFQKSYEELAAIIYGIYKLSFDEGIEDGYSIYYQCSVATSQQETSNVAVTQESETVENTESEQAAVVENPINPMAEEQSKKEEVEQKPINTEDIEGQTAENVINPMAETVATSQQNEDIMNSPEVEETAEDNNKKTDPDNEIDSQMLWQARQALSNMATAFNLKSYKAALQDAKHFIHYLSKAIGEDDE